jgi:hypothetical protein
VTAISPREGAPGTVVTFKGKRFGASQSGGWVTFSGSSAQVVSWSDTVIKAIVPRDAASGYAGVVAHGMTSNGILYGPLGSPFVASVEAPMGSSWPPVLIPGKQASIRGRGFGVGIGRIAIGGLMVQATYWSPTEVRFTVPRKMRDGYVGVVRRDAWTSNGVWVPTAPRLDSVSSQVVGPLGSVTLTGLEFGESRGARQAYIGGRPASVTSWSDNQVTMQLPAVPTRYVGVGTNSACSNGIWVHVRHTSIRSAPCPSDGRSRDDFGADSARRSEPARS